MLIGAAVREAAVRGLHVQPMFSLYSSHGPVFRCMLRITRSKLWPAAHYAFVAHSHTTGDTRALPFQSLGDSSTGLAAAQQRAQHSGGSGAGVGAEVEGRRTLSVAGPMWTGPLHSREDVAAMQALACERQWGGSGLGAGAPPGARKQQLSLEKLLAALICESDPALPPYFMPLRDVAVHGRLAGPPPVAPLVAALQSEGFAACRSHVEVRRMMCTEW